MIDRIMANLRKAFGNRGVKYGIIVFCFQFLSFALSLPAQNRPVISSISTSSAAVGAVISITGTDFNTDPAKNIVFFGATKANVVSASATELGVSVPAGATHDFITVLDLQTGLSAYSPAKFLSVFDGGGANVSFASKIDLPDAGYPLEVALSDFNGDGKPDIVAVNEYTQNITIYKNTSQPRSISFVAQADLLAGVNPDGLAIADFNGDGKPDLVVSNNNAGNVSVFVNTSTASTISFAAKKDYSCGATPSSIAVNDFDGDGKPDIAIGLVNGGSGQIAILRNTSTQADVSFVNTGLGLYGGLSLRSVYAGDLDNDGKPDLAAISESNLSLGAYRNTSSPGTISFTSKITLLTNAVTTLNMTDIDLDGKLDIIMGLNNTSTFDVLRNTSSSGSISISSGNLTTLAVPGISRIATNDFNGDGKVDIGISNQWNSVINVIQGNASPGSIQYGTKINFTAGDKPVGLASGDLDGDGKADLVVANFNSEFISVFRNTTSLPPTITAFAPLSAGAGSTLTVTGTNLGEVTGVTLGGTSAASFNVLSSTEMIVTVGAGSSGTLSITAAGGMTSMSGFVFVPAPTINVFAPVSGMTGTVVTIAGTNFTGATAVSFGGVNAASFTVLSPTRIQAVVAGGNSGTVAVQTMGGTGTRSGFAFQPPPTISSISPATGPTGTMVTITGSNFIGTDSVSFGGTTASFHTVLSSTTVRAWVGAGSSGDVSLRTPSGVISYTGFTYQASPYISSSTPTMGKSGTTITITGYNFTGVTGVSIGGASAASFNVLSSTTLTAVVGSGASGVIAVTNSEGTGSGSSFGYLPASPAISSFSPVSAAVGSTVTITGTDFNTDPSANIVFFGATRATVVSASATQLSVLVPSGATHAAITVLDSITGLSGYSQKNFLPVFDGAGAAISFASKKDFTTGSYPFRVATADFNNDGKPDMAVINQNANTVSVFKNTSVAKNISFGAKTDYATGNKPNDLTIGDVNGDGKPDLIVGNYNSQNVSILTNNSTAGTISFAAKRDISVFVPVYGVQVNDFDLDGNLDIVITKPSSHFVTVFANAKATYPDTVSLLTPGSPMFLCVNDLDDDGKPDIATINQTNGTVSIYRNTSAPGIISFATRNDLAVTLSGAMSLGDIDGDGKADLILSNQSGTGFEVLKNTSTTGSISFTSGNGTALSQPGVTGITMHDFNGDGKIDIGVSSSGNNSVSAIQNNSTPGSFLYGNTTALLPGSSPQGMTNNDIDGDGKPDLLVVNAGANTVSVFRNTSSSIPPVISSFAPLSALQGATLTVTGSNFEDIIDVKLGGISAASFNVLSSTAMTVVVGAGASGTLSITSAGGTAGLSGFVYLALPTITSISPSTALSGTAITITGTNFTDVAAVGFGGINAVSFTVLSSTVIQAVVGSGSSGSVTVQTPGGTASKTGFVYLVPPVITSVAPLSAIQGSTLTITGSNFQGVTAVQLGGTNAASFTVISSTLISVTVGNGSSGSISVTTAGGTAGLSGFVFLPPPSISSVSPVSAAVGATISITGIHFNTTASSNIVFFGATRATVVTASDTVLTVTVPSGASHDFITVLDQQTGLSSYSPNKFLPVFNGGGANASFATKINLPALSYAVDLALRDFNNDGKSDIIAISEFSSNILVYKNTSQPRNISFAAQSDLLAGAKPVALATGDLNGDGKPDLVVTNYNSGTVSVFVNTSTGSTVSFAAKKDFSLGATPYSVTIADIDKDGKPDIISGTTTGGTIVTLRNTSTQADVSFVDAGATLVPGTYLRSVSVGDLDNDGKADIAAISEGSSTLFMYKNTSSPGTVSYGAKTNLLSNTVTVMQMADMDLDGRLDIITGLQSASTFDVLRNTGSGGTISFSSGNLTSLATSGLSRIATHDFNGDGKVDMGISNQWNSVINLIQGNASPGSIQYGTKMTLPPVSADAQPVGITGGDIDGDGKPDLLVANYNANSISVFRNTTSAVAPVITAFAPLSSVQGGTLTVTGSNFEDIIDVKLGGINASSFNVLSSTMMTVVVGNGASGTLSITSAGGTGGLSGFVFVPVPAIASVSPSGGISGTVVTITGTNFIDVSAVSFGGIPAASFSVLTSTVVEAIVGSGASGSVTLQAAGGTASITGFLYQPGPDIISISPSSAATGASITITGTDFTGAIAVKFGGVNASSFTVVSSTVIQAVVGIGNSGSVAVQTPAGADSITGFSYQAIPGITSITPASGTTGTAITITGYNFTGTTAVSFGGTNAASFNVLSPTTIIAVVGSGASGAISVTNSDGTGTKSGFTFLLPAPSIVSVSPVSAAVGATISITGTHFNTTASNNIVFFGATRATVVTANDTVLTVTVPSGASHDFITVLDQQTGLSAYSPNKFLPVFNGGGANASFATKINLPALSYAVDLALRDFNNDGKSDIVAISEFSSNILVYKNTSQPRNISFAAQSDLLAGAKPVALATGDLNGDGKPDLVVTNYNSGTVSVFVNTSTDSTVSFAAKKDFSLGATPYSVTIADIDKDGKPDIISGTTTGGTIVTLRNTSTQADVSFVDAGATLVPGTYLRSVSVGDLDNDGKADIAAISEGSTTLFMYKNTSSPGTVSYGSKTNLMSNAVTTMQIADMDLDGRLDIITGLQSASTFDVLRNTGSGGTISFSSGNLTSLATSGLSRIATHDFNGDGKVDMGISNQWNSVINLIQGNASPGSIQYGTKMTLPPVSADAQPVGITGGDIDGDGKPDLLVANYNANSISVFRNTTSAVAPVITAFAPLSSVQGGTLTVTGSNFEDIIDVKLGGINASSFNVLSSTMMTVVVGNGASGTLSITSAGGTGALSGFTYLAPPTISSFAPSAATSGTAITITGSNFNGITGVGFGGVSASSFTVLSPSTLIAIVGSGASGTISVTNAQGTGLKTGFTFLFPTPVISSFAPVSGGAGATITITGSNLSAVTSVTIGGTAAASFSVLSSTVIAAVLGNGSSGSVAVVSAGGNASKAGFVYVQPVKISGDSAMCPDMHIVLTSSDSSGIQWYRNDTLIPGAISASYEATKAGSYKVIRTYDNTPYISNVINVAVNMRPVAIFTTDTDAMQCLNKNSFRFSNTSTIADNASLSYRWSFGDGSPISDQKDASHSYGAAGTYTVKLLVYSDSGCADSVMQTMVVKPQPVLTVQQPAAICNTTGTLALDITNPALYTGTDAGLSFSFWKDSLATQSIANAAAISVTGIYYVKAMSTSGCFAIEPVKVTLNALPVVAPITGGNNVCVGATTQLNNVTAGGVWTSSNPQSLLIDNAGKATGKIPGSYEISYKYIDPVTGCANAAALTVTVSPSPIAGKPSLANYISDTLVCFDNQLSIAAGGTYDKYLWSTGETTSSVTVSSDAVVWLKVGSNQSACYSESSVVVTAKKNITPKPVVSRQGDNLVSSSALSYQWLFNSKLTGDKTAQIPIAQRGAYAVNTSADGYCWNVSDDYIVFFDPVPVKKVFDLVSYPNPSSGNFNLQLSFDNNITAAIKITLVNQSGVSVWSATKLIFNDKSIKIPVSVVLTKGVFTVRVEVNGETVTQQLIIM